MADHIYRSALEQGIGTRLPYWASLEPVPAVPTVQAVQTVSESEKILIIDYPFSIARSARLYIDFHTVLGALLGEHPAHPLFAFLALQTPHEGTIEKTLSV